MGEPPDEDIRTLAAVVRCEEQGKVVSVLTIMEFECHNWKDVFPVDAWAMFMRNQCFYTRTGFDLCLDGNQNGQTMSVKGLASRIPGNTEAWKALYEVNRGAIEGDPNRIVPGQMFHILHRVNRR